MPKGGKKLSQGGGGEECNQKNGGVQTGGRARPVKGVRGKGINWGGAKIKAKNNGNLFKPESHQGQSLKSVQTMTKEKKNGERGKGGGGEVRQE